MKIIFADSNKLYGLWRSLALHNSDLSRSDLLAIIHKLGHKVIISSFVLSEVFNYCLRDNIPYNQLLLQKFLTLTHFKLYNSVIANDGYLSYVCDLDDAQILQDCVESGCDCLLTSNTKDFKIDMISSQFDVEVISEL